VTGIEQLVIAGWTGRDEAVAVALASCANPRAVLVNDKGEYLSCAASGAGIIGSTVAQSRFDDCMADAKAKGYRTERQE
jgi:hypothetical protein